MKKEAMFYEKLDRKRVRCRLCAHSCLIADSRFGICGVRQNLEGTLHTMIYAQVVAANIDPVEKKPLYHFLPGTISYSVGTMGCNFQCGFCQNWQISQVGESGVDPFSAGWELLPDTVVREAMKNNCLSISYTYTEPTIFFEYAYDTARKAKDADLRNIFVSNGYMPAPVIDEIAPYLDAANIDLKSFSKEYYRRNCKADLQPVLDCIAHMKEKGIWIEVTTLIIPGENDSERELKAIAGFLAGLDRGIPWHVTAFHPDYHFRGYPETAEETLHRAQEIGLAQGLYYVYAGNIPGEARTLCYACGEVLVTRHRFNTSGVNLKDGHCPKCGAKIGGIWKRPERNGKEKVEMIADV